MLPLSVCMHCNLWWGHYNDIGSSESELWIWAFIPIISLSRKTHATFGAAGASFFQILSFVWSAREYSPSLRLQKMKWPHDLIFHAMPMACVVMMSGRGTLFFDSIQVTHATITYHNGHHIYYRLYMATACMTPSKKVMTWITFCCCLLPHHYSLPRGHPRHYLHWLG